MVRLGVPFDTSGAPAPMPLSELDWDSVDSCRSYARSHLACAKAGWAARPVVADDSIPVIQNLAGTGAIGAALVKDAVVHHESDTNYLEPVIRDWSKDMPRIGFDPDNPWYRAMMTMLKVYVEAWDGSFGLIPYTHFDPLDLANQWRGNDLFYDYYEHPADLRELLTRATDAILALERDMRGSFMSGYGFEGCVVGGAWAPGNYLSCDAGDLCSPETLATWGLPFTQRIVEAWGGAFLHHHELGAYQIPTWARCRGLSLQFLNRDPNTPHLAHSITDEIIEASRCVPVSFIATWSEFMAHAESWKRGRFFVIVTCENADQARAASARLPSLRNF